MKTQIIITLAALICPLTLTSNFSFAAKTGASKEERKQMAEMHTKMAACLESDKPMNECHDEMMTSCKSMMGKSGCPMMGEMGHMKGMMQGQNMMMDSKNETKSDKKSKK